MYQISRLPHDLVDESTCSSSLSLRHCFGEIRHVQTECMDKSSHAAIACSDMGFLIACIKIPQSPPARAVLYTK